MSKKKAKTRGRSRSPPRESQYESVKSTLSNSSRDLGEDRGFDPSADRLDSQLEKLSEARSVISFDERDRSSSRIDTQSDSSEGSELARSTQSPTEKSEKADKSGKSNKLRPGGKSIHKSPAKPAGGKSTKSKKKKTSNGRKVSKNKSKSVHHKKSNANLKPSKTIKSRGMAKTPVIVSPNGGKSGKTLFKSSMATTSKLPVPRPNMRLVPVERLKELSTGCFLVKYRSAVKKLNAKEPQPSVLCPLNTSPKQPTPVINDTTTNTEMPIDPEKMKLMQELWACFEALMQKQKTPSTIGSTLQPKGCPTTTTVAGQPNLTDRPTKEEMEDLNDQLSDLNTSINTLRFSYGSIIRSLVQMQARQKRAKMNLGPVKCDEKSGSSGPESGQESITVEKIAERARQTNYSEKYALERFVENDTRDQAFQELFREVNEVNIALTRFKTLFDAEGYFQEQAYLESDFRLTRQLYVECYKIVSEMEQAVARVLRAYNTEMLDMFRLK